MNEAGTVGYQRFDFERRAIDSEREAFFMRITGPGDFRYQCADLGILITRGRSMDDNFKLSIRARDWIRGIQKHYADKPIVTTEAMWKAGARCVITCPSWCRSGCSWSSWPVAVMWSRASCRCGARRPTSPAVHKACGWTQRAMKPRR